MSIELESHHMRDMERMRVVHLEGGRPREVEDDLVVEEPLEIRVNGTTLAVTMRTPGDDFDLAVGLLRSEGVITRSDEIGTMAYCPEEEQPELKNVVSIGLLDVDRRLEPSRLGWMNSSCGLCAKATLEAIRQSAQPVKSGMSVEPGVLLGMPAEMRRLQGNFARTGGIHAACLFDCSGRVILIREDIGRHNAVDKVIGAALRQGIDMCDSILLVSGRLGFEIAQKALSAAIPLVCSISAPSSMAVDLANEFGITAVGFVRQQSLNIYSHSQRVVNGLSKHLA